METVSRAELIEVMVQLRREVEAQRRENEELRRGQRGWTAPFSRGTHKTNPKPPGRRPGEGPFLRRAEPWGSNQELIRALVETLSCPDCGGALERAGTGLAWVTDIEERPRPVVKRYEMEICRCLKCGRQVRGRHADLAAGQHGATAHRPGPRVKAAACALHFNFGVPLRKGAAMLKELTGIEVTPSALTQEALKRAEGQVGKAYQQLRARVKGAPFVPADDTGWRMAGDPAQWMVLETDRETVFRIRPRHRNEEVRK